MTEQATNSGSMACMANDSHALLVLLLRAF